MPSGTKNETTFCINLIFICDSRRIVSKYYLLNPINNNTNSYYLFLIVEHLFVNIIF